MMGYIYVWEHYGGGQQIDAAWSPIFEDLYSPKLDFMDTRASSVFPLFLLNHRFSNAPTHTVHSRLPLSIERCECLCHQETPWEARQCMCGGDDLHGNTPSLRMHVDGCVLSNSTIASTRIPLTHPVIFRAILSLQAKLRPDQDSLPICGCIYGPSESGQQ